MRYECAQKQRTSVKKNEARVFSHGAREVTRTGRRRTGLLSRAESPSSSSRSRFSSKLEKKCWLRAGGRIDREEIVAAVNSLWWPIQGKPWRGSLSRPQTHPSTAESYDWRIVLARGGELRDRTAISIPLVPFLYCCLLRSRFARLSTVVLEIFYILVKSSELF